MKIQIKNLAGLLRTAGLVIFLSVGNGAWAQSSNCHVLYDGVDLITKIYRTELAPQLLFNYSPPEVKNNLQEENLVNCSAQLLQVDKENFLHLNLTINSLLAQKEYGEVQIDNLLKIKLIDGKEIELKCYAGSKGVLSEDRKSYIFPLGYKLSNRNVKTLNKKEIDKIGIQWSTGYEEYTIYEVDFFMNQISCLNQTIQKPN